MRQRHKFTDDEAHSATSANLGRLPFLELFGLQADINRVSESLTASGILHFESGLRNKHEMNISHSTEVCHAQVEGFATIVEGMQEPFLSPAPLVI